MNKWQKMRDEIANERSNEVAKRFSSGFEICVHDIVTTAELQFKAGWDAAVASGAKAPKQRCERCNWLRPLALDICPNCGNETWKEE